MSAHSHNDHNDPNLHPEGSVIKAQPILMFLIILTIATAGAFFLVKGMLWGLAKVETTMTPQTPATMVGGDTRKLPPEPRLQGAPTTGSTAGTDTASQLPLVEMAEYRKQMEKKVTGYGWVNKEAGVAHIPIERAKEMIAEEAGKENNGRLGMLPGSVAELEKAAEARKSMMNMDSSAGNMIKKQ
jgi:hypothetical protein